MGLWVGFEMGLSKIGTHQHSKLTWGVISGDEEKILKNSKTSQHRRPIVAFS
jgi:hypothetical protein